MKDKPNCFIQGRAIGPIRKPGKNMSTHVLNSLAKRDKAP